MKQFNRQTGKKAEALAVAVLREKGYKILEQNWGNKFGEIDIIAQDGKTLVFVEVKAKTGTNLGTPEEMVGQGKLGKVQQMAMRYLEGKDVPCRIDVVAVVLEASGELERLTHYENVY
ncbi:YraN family protein [Microgenomates group bacterium RBG_16_45_19]|nr:MAG: YraN family protein [Microgenomates group bacterium RBG_16_45_19]